MKFSVKRLIFLMAGLLAIVFNVKPMVDSDTSKFFGGAKSASELKNRIDAKFDSSGCLKGYCLLPYSRPGVADTKLREVGAVKAETRSRLDYLGDSPYQNPSIAQADRAELERREAALSRIERCVTWFKENTKSAERQIMLELGEVDRITKMQAKDVDEHGLLVAKSVNQQLIVPSAELGVCLGQVRKDFTDSDGYEDPVVRAAIGSVHKLSDDAEKYAESLRAIDRASSARARILAKEARDKEVCAVNASPWGCRIKHAGADIADGWMAASDLVTNKALIAKDAVRDFDWAGKCASFVPCNSVCQKFVAQPDWAKGAESAALAAVGLYVAYKLSKLGWRGACALKNLLWTNRSATARAAILTALGTAVAVTPCVAMQCGYLQ